MLSGRSDAEIARIVNFYDYLEVQPIGNNHFMIEKEDCYVQNEEDLRDLKPQGRGTRLEISQAGCGNV